jgi:hypothetical protein
MQFTIKNIVSVMTKNMLGVAQNAGWFCRERTCPFSTSIPGGWSEGVDLPPETLKEIANEIGNEFLEICY